MNDSKRKHQKWLLKKARKLAKKSHAKKRGRSHFNPPTAKDVPKEKKVDLEAPIVVKQVPNHFSLTENPEETIAFITDLISEINHKQYGKKIIIDSDTVEYVTVDALIYLIAIMQNEKINYEMKYQYSGNLPKNPDAYKVYQESGFMDYVHSKVRKLPSNTEKKKIAFGKIDDPEKSAEFCTFVYQHFGKDKKFTIPLQKVLIELMSNVAHHAYEENEAIANNWYMYAEHKDNRIKFVFVDTGSGIIKTVQKKIREKVFRFFGVHTVDGEILKSVFLGDFQRTETEKPYRGNGLKTVYEDVSNGPFENFTVVTGKGVCSIEPISGEISYNTYQQNLHGTLFTFDYVE